MRHQAIAIVGDSFDSRSKVASLLSSTWGLQYRHPTGNYAAKLIHEEVMLGQWESGYNGELKHLVYKPRMMRGYSLSDEIFPEYNDLYINRRHLAKFFCDWIDSYNRLNSGFGLYGYCVEQGEQIITGIRRRDHLASCLRNRIISMSIWVNDPTGKPDPTIDFGPDACDFSLSYIPEETSRYIESIKRISNFFSSSHMAIA